ncbi:MAG: hypothetical protein RBR40_11360 [Tenuifilaceae bacterium]|nr:hypothetical protein [Tenuifilaceae bacterium]
MVIASMGEVASHSTLVMTGEEMSDELRVPGCELRVAGCEFAYPNMVCEALIANS